MAVIQKDGLSHEGKVNLPRVLIVHQSGTAFAALQLQLNAYHEGQGKGI